MENDKAMYANQNDRHMQRIRRWKVNFMTWMTNNLGRRKVSDPVMA
jgi:hypothetical protein